VETLEAMQESGCSPHAAVYSSVIDALWQTGIVWAQAKALQLFSHAVECVPRPPAMLLLTRHRLPIGTVILRICSAIRCPTETLLVERQSTCIAI